MAHKKVKLHSAQPLNVAKPGLLIWKYQAGRKWPVPL